MAGVLYHRVLQRRQMICRGADSQIVEARPKKLLRLTTVRVRGQLCSLMTGLRLDDNSSSAHACLDQPYTHSERFDVQTNVDNVTDCNSCIKTTRFLYSGRRTPVQRIKVSANSSPEEYRWAFVQT